MDTIPPETPKPSFFRSHKVLYLIFGLCLVGIWSYYAMLAPTSNRSRANRQPTIIHISAGDSLNKVAKDLENKKIVKHSSVLKVFLTIFNLDRQIEKGDYMFNENMPVWSVAWMLAHGDHHINPTKITFKEGITNNEMSDILSKNLAVFRKDLFLSDPRALEGYMFPDTYFFFPYTTESEVLSEITSNFTKRISPYKDDISSSEHTIDEIVKMASVLEKEANGKEDIGIISGILWKRISKGMLLQVDAARETYKEAGLPKKPISNPGILSIEASIRPIDSPYLFYLHDKNGQVHFAKTYTEHISNINKYLR